jgi:putative transposase
MKKSKFTESQIAFVLKQAEEGASIAEVCRKAENSEATVYNWCRKYGGLLPSEMRRLRQLEEENGRLKRIVADLSLDKEMLQDVILVRLPSPGTAAGLVGYRRCLTMQIFRISR